MPNLHETKTGRRFYEKDVPSLVRGIEDLTNVLKLQAEIMSGAMGIKNSDSDFLQFKKLDNSPHDALSLAAGGELYMIAEVEQEDSGLRLSIFLDSTEDPITIRPALFEPDGDGGGIRRPGVTDEVVSAEIKCIENSIQTLCEHLEVLKQL